MAEQYLMKLDGLEVGSWSPGAEGENVPCTQVHLTMRIKALGITTVMRLKSRAVCDELIASLIEHRDFVFGEDSAHGTDGSMGADGEDVRRVQPAGDEVRKWWYALLEDEIPQLMTAEEAVNYTGPFESEQEAFIACIIEHGERSDRLLAELKTAEGALEAITMSDLATGTACEWCGGIRWTAEGDRPDIDHAPNCPVRIAQEALAALRADSEHDSAERSL